MIRHWLLRHAATLIYAAVRWRTIHILLLCHRLLPGPAWRRWDATPPLITDAFASAAAAPPPNHMPFAFSLYWMTIHFQRQRATWAATARRHITPLLITADYTLRHAGAFHIFRDERRAPPLQAFSSSDGIFIKHWFASAAISRCRAFIAYAFYYS